MALLGVMDIARDNPYAVLLRWLVMHEMQRILDNLPPSDDPVNNPRLYLHWQWREHFVSPDQYVEANFYPATAGSDTPRWGDVNMGEILAPILRRPIIRITPGTRPISATDRRQVPSGTDTLYIRNIDGTTTVLYS
jgi:hypothetical protein